MVTIPATIADKLLGTVLDYLKKGGESLVKNIATKKEIKKAIERAAERFGSEYDNKELARALTIDTKFYDLPSIQKAIRELLEHPFDSASQVRIENEFAMVLPESQRGLSNQAAQMYFEIIREELIGVTELNDKLKLIYLKRSAEATERTAVGVEKLVSTYGKSPNLEEAKRRYLKYIIDSNQYVDPRGIMQTRRPVTLKLDEVYISLTAERDIASQDADIAYSNRVNWDYEKEDLDDSDNFDTQSYPSEIIDLSKAVRENSRVVILGDPGSGKTTLMRFLAFQFATAYLSQGFDEQSGKLNQVVDKDDNNYGIPCLPVLIRIANYADAFSKNHSLSLKEYLIDNYDGGEENKDTAREIISNTLRNGSSILLFDGLDEVVSIGDRVEIGRNIEKFIASCHPKNRFVITSRIAGYRTAPLVGDFTHFVLHALDRPQIEKFLSKWCPAVEYAQTPDIPSDEIKKRSNDEKEGILEAVDNNLGVRRLASNPLMLTILALIHRAGTTLPSRRVELYELAVKTLLEYWQLARGIPKKEIVREIEALRLLGPLAYWMHENKPRGYASEGEIKEQLRRFLGIARNIPPESEEVEIVVDDFLKRVREHTGIFVERAPNQYGFMHLTFEEYFVAREIIRRRDDISGKIYHYRHHPRWEEPILLAIAFLSNDYPDDASEIISTAILAKGALAEKQGFVSSPYESILHRDILLAVRTLADGLGLSVSFSNEVIGEFLNSYCASTGQGGVISFRERVQKLLYDLHGNEINARIAERSLAMLDSSEIGVRLRIADILGWLGVVDDNVVEKLLLLLKDENSDVRSHAASAIGWLNVVNNRIIYGLQEAIKDRNKEVRWRALYAMAFLGIGVDSSLDIILSLLQDGSPHVRGSALYAIGELKIKDKAIVDGVLLALKDKKVSVRWRAISALEKLGIRDKKVVDGLLLALQDARWYVRTVSAKTLSNLGLIDENLVQEILSLLESKNVHIQRRAILSLGHLGIRTDVIVSILLDALKHQDRAVRGNAAVALGRLKVNEPKIIDGLLITLHDAQSSVRQRVAESLGYLGASDYRVIDSLLAAIKDQSVDVRRGAISAFEKLEIVNDAVASALVNALSDQNNDIRFYAASALGKLDVATETVLDGLLQLLGHEEDFVREKAAQSLGRICGNRSEVVKTETRKFVQEALYKNYVDSNDYRLLNSLWRALWDSTSIV